MCNLPQSVISIIVADANSEILARLFSEQVVLSFGMVAVIVVDLDSKFLCDFMVICNALDIRF